MSKELRSELDLVRDRFREYVEEHEMHRAWCNGGYEGGTCTCSLQKRIAKILAPDPYPSDDRDYVPEEQPKGGRS